MGDPDPLRLVEAGYRWIPDEHEWLAGIADAARPFAVGDGVGAYVLDLSKRTEVAAFAGEAALERRIREFTTGFDLATARLVYAPTEFVGNAAYRVRRIARERGDDPDAFQRRHAIDAFALIGGDPRARSIAIAFAAKQQALLDPNHAFPRGRALGLAAAHLAAALRLRRLAAPSPDEADCVFGANGRLLHATTDAQSRRETLVEAVMRRERARGRLRRVDPDEAAKLWSVLVAGKWSIVDYVDRDQKRFVLARKNPLAGPDLLALTVHECDVVWLATFGHSRKYIAYELGISAATVTKRLTSAMRKLRVGSRRELLRKLGTP